MFKNFMWKFFPPKKITEEDVEAAKCAFDNARNAPYVPNSYVWEVATNHDYTEKCRQYYVALVGAKKRYEEYLNS